MLVDQKVLSNLKDLITVSGISIPETKRETIQRSIKHVLHSDFFASCSTCANVRGGRLSPKVFL
jgi:hypothetical protein